MKILPVIFFASFAVVTTQAQIANTRWKTAINRNAPLNVILDFKKDTVSVYTVADSSIIETMSYKSDGPSITFLKISGQSDCDNDTPGKYSFRVLNDSLYLNLWQDACDDRWPALDTTKWIRWKEHPGAMVDEAILKQYTGVYQVDPAHPITVSFADGKLYAEGRNNGLPKSPLVAVSNTKFFLRIAGVEWDFIKDAAGKVTALISHEQKDYRLKKVK